MRALSIVLMIAGVAVLLYGQHAKSVSAVGCGAIMLGWSFDLRICALERTRKEPRE